MPLFRHTFPVSKPVARAILYISGLGQYELSLNGRKVGDDVLAPGWTLYPKTVFYNAYDVTRALKSGENALGVMLGNGMYNVPKTPNRYTKFTGSRGEPKLIAQLLLEYADGTTSLVTSDSTWKTVPGPIVYSHTYGGEDFDARQEPRAGTPRLQRAQWSAARETEGPGGRLLAEQNPPIRVMRTYRPVKVTHPKPGVTIYDLARTSPAGPASPSAAPPAQP